MPERTTSSQSALLWGAAGAPIAGHAESGDVHLVVPRPDGVLVGVIDGLGHGQEAARAAERAVEFLGHMPDHNLIAMIKRLHHNLIGSRGVVITLARISTVENTLTWLSVGNVQGVLIRADPEIEPALESVVQRGGVVGYKLPPLVASVLTINPGDLLVLATDGIRPDYLSSVVPGEDPQHQAERLLSRYARPDDDSLILVARYHATG